MEKALRIILPLLILGLGYLVYDSIARPIREQKKIDHIEGKIKERLGHIKAAQFAYRDRFNQFAPNFDTLLLALKNEKMPIVKVVGDLEDTAAVITRDTSYVSLAEVAFPQGGVDIDSLPFVPLNPNGVKFKMEAAIVEVNGTNVPVFMVQDPEPYNKAKALTLGSTSEPIYTGNWE